MKLNKRSEKKGRISKPESLTFHNCLQDIYNSLNTAWNQDDRNEGAKRKAYKNWSKNINVEEFENIFMEKTYITVS